MIGARPITSSPGYHWFAYYDKEQFDPTNRYVLGMEVDFEGRSPRPDAEIRLGGIDLQQGNRWREIGRSTAWCWQQGCMLQWVPGTTSTVIYNDREGEEYVSRLLDINTESIRTLPAPVYALSADGTRAVSTDFRRVNDMRPGYGYCGIPDPNHDCLAPDDSGIWLQDLHSGEHRLVISIAQIAAIPFPHGDLSGAKHYFNHLLVAPDSERFVFLHRWRTDGGPLQTRMLCAHLDGSDIRVVNDTGLVSHFIWRDPEHVLMFTRDPTFKRPDHRGFSLFDVTTGSSELVLDDPNDGHCSYLRGSGPPQGWILNDSYPTGGAREQRLYLYDPKTHRRLDLGEFASPPEYDGEWRCDLHPRSSGDGRLITIDSVHAGEGRQIYLMDLAPILD